MRASMQLVGLEVEVDPYVVVSLHHTTKVRNATRGNRAGGGLMSRYTSPQAIALEQLVISIVEQTRHVCEPQACQRTLDKAESAEEWHLLFVKEWQ